MKIQHVLTAGVIGFVILWVASAIYVSTQEPETTMTPNSKGTGWVGYRGLYDLELARGNKVARQYEPTAPSDDSGALRLFLGPNEFYVGSNLDFAHSTANWIRRGGRAVVVDRQEKKDETDGDDDPIHRPQRLTELVLPTTNLVRITRKPRDWQRTMFAPKSLLENSHATLKWIRSKVGDGDSPRTAVTQAHVVGDGAFAAITPVYRELVLPQVDLIVFKDLPSENLLGSIRIRDGSDHVIAALFRHGRGQVLILSDERLLTNGLLQYPGMGAFFVDLLETVGPGLPRIFDHFFLGEAVRGNPAWLLARFPYSVFALCVLLTALIVPWTFAGRLGPPDPDPVSPQPGLLAQIGMVANMLGHRRHQSDNLLALHSGVLWHLRSEFGIPRGPAATANLLAVMERKAPQRAARLLRASESLRRLDWRRVSQQEVLTLGQELVKCLSTK